MAELQSIKLATAAGLADAFPVAGAAELGVAIGGEAGQLLCSGSTVDLQSLKLSAACKFLHVDLSPLSCEWRAAEVPSLQCALSHAHARTPDCLCPPPPPPPPPTLATL